MSLISIEKEVEKILSNTYAEQSDFDAAVGPCLNRDYKSAHHFIRMIMMSGNSEVKNKIFKCKSISSFLQSNYKRVTTSVLSEKRYSEKEIFRDCDRIFIIDQYPWVDCAVPVRDMIKELCEAYNYKEIIFYDIDHKWKIITTQTIDKLDEIWEAKRQSLFDDPHYRSYKSVSDERLPDWLKKKYFSKKNCEVGEYHGWIPDNFQEELFKLELSKK